MKLNIISKVSVGVALLFMFVFLFSLTGTLCASDEYKNISKLRILKNNYYMIDSNQNVLLFGSKSDLENGNVKTISERLEEEKTTKPFEALKDVVILQNGEIFLIDGIADGIFEYDKNGIFFFDHNRFENGASITDLVAICGDYNDNVFALQIDNGYKILKKSKDDDYFSVIVSIDDEKMTQLGLEEDTNALITCDFENQTLFVASNGVLIKIQNQEVAVLYNYNYTATDIAIDYLGYPYLSLDNKTILKYQDNEALFLEISTNTFSLNFENGDINYINNDSIKTFTNNFVNNLSKFNHPVNYLEKTNLTSSAEIFNVTTNSYVYKYPLKVSLLEEIATDTKVIKLYDSIDYPNYSYVLLSKNDSIIPCYINKNNLEQIQSNEINKNLRTFTANTKLFKYPSADKVNGQSLHLTKIPATTSLLVKTDACNFADSQGRLFYEVVYQDKTYYVLRSMVTTLGTEEGAVTLKTNNAELKSKHDVNIYAGLNSDNIIGTMKVGANFYVNSSSINKNIKRTYVEYLDKNNNYICGFIDTKYIKIKEASPLIIVGVFFVLIVMILILILILYFVNQRNKVKSELKNLNNK